MIIQRQYCNTCEKELNFRNGKCPDCAERERREAVAIWQSKTVEEKLLDLHKRLLKLEAGPPTY